MNNIQSFSFMRSFAEAMEMFNEKQQKEFLLAIVKYVFYDENPDFSGSLKIAWVLIEPILTKSKNKSHTNQN